MEDNTASEFIRTEAATYGCKILQLYTNTMRTANDTLTVSVYAAQKTVDFWLRYFCISLNSAFFKIKTITRNIMFFIDRTSYSYR